jgi:hypothetical protein
MDVPAERAPRESASPALRGRRGVTIHASEDLAAAREKAIRVIEKPRSLSEPRRRAGHLLRLNGGALAADSHQFWTLPAASRVAGISHVWACDLGEHSFGAAAIMLCATHLHREDWVVVLCSPER